MSKKQLVLNALSQLPEDCTFADMTEKLRFLAGIQEGFDQIDRGEIIPHEKILEEMASWLSE
jgi:predicted transcriptional regulator